MAEIITLENKLHADGFYRLHLMSNDSIEYPVPAWAQVERKVDAGAHVLKAEWLYRGACEIDHSPCDWRVIMWGMLAGDRISEQAVLAARAFRSAFGELPEFVFVRRLPKGIEIGTSIPIDGGELGLFDAEFVPASVMIVR